MPESIPEVNPATPDEPILLPAAALQRHRQANLAVTKIFLIGLPITTLLSWICSSRFIAEKDCVSGCTLLFSLFGFLLVYTIALIAGEKIDRTAP